MTLEPISLALASASTAVVLWIVCSVLVVLLPGMMMSMTGDMMHANMSQMSWTMSLFGFFVVYIFKRSFIDPWFDGSG